MSLRSTYSFALPLTTLASALLLAFSPSHAAETTAANTPTTRTTDGKVVLPTVSVTANPLGRTLSEISTPATTLSGRALSLRQASSLGETLNGLTGISATYFGPNASRPIIRGLDGDRIRLMENGAGLIDASSLSFDHATPIEPLLVERIEVVRGAAALMYGGNATGGVVNTIDNRIPKNAVQGVNGGAELRYGGAETERAGSASLEAGNGQWAIHADVSERKTDDLKIPNYARSSRLRALDDPNQEQAKGRLPNSASKNNSGALGSSYTWQDGYIGVSYSGYNSTYGTVAEPDVNIRMQSNRLDAAGEIRNLTGFIDGVKFKLNQNDYEHKEFDVPTGEVGTTFKNKGYEARLEATHQSIRTDWGALKGAFGLQSGQIKFSALGDEAFVPQTKTDTQALFAFEELQQGNWRFNLGGRIESNKVRSDGGGPDDPNSGAPRFDPAQTRQFTPKSYALGSIYNLNAHQSIAANVAHTDRAPTFYELFANGPHAATGRYELGNPNFSMEQSNAIDLAWRLKQGPHSASIGAFYTRFNNYIGLFDTANTRSEEGELNPATADALPEQVYRQVPAIFKGIEAEGRYRLWEKAGNLDFIVHGDLTRATNRDTGEALPRIAPLRISTALAYTQNDWTGQLEIIRASAQQRVPNGDSTTNGYTQVNADISYQLRVGTSQVMLFAKLYNLTNADIRSATSILRDIAPYGGRSIKTGIRLVF